MSDLKDTSEPGHVDPLTDARFQCFTEDDRHFLAVFFRHHPQVADNFRFFLTLPEPMRPQYAEGELKKIERSEWFACGVSKSANIEPHSPGVAQLIEDTFRQPCSLPESFPRNLQQQTVWAMSEMAKTHTYVKAIISDLNSDEPVALEDKKRVEKLAVKAIFAAPIYTGTAGSRTPGKLALAEEYIDQQTPMSQLVHDFSNIHAVMTAIFFDIKFPNHLGELFDKFHASATRQMKTETGKSFLADLEQHKEEYERDMSDRIKAQRRTGVER